MARTIHGNPVSPETGDPVIFRGIMKKVPARGMIDHRAGFLKPQIIGPRDRKIHPVDHIFTVFVVKVSVSHAASSEDYFQCNHIISEPGVKRNDAIWSCLSGVGDS